MDMLLPLARSLLVMEESVHSASPPSPSRLTAPGTRRRRPSGQRTPPATPPVTPPHPSSAADAHPFSSPAMDMDYAQWTEYTARRSVVRFRTRTRAKRLNSRNLSALRLPPSALLHRLLQHQYERSRHPDSDTAEKAVALFYCWFFGWINDAYFHLCGGGSECSLPRWGVACLLVTVATVALVMSIVGLVHLLVITGTTMLHAAVNFGAFVFITFIIVIGTLAIVNFG